MTAPTLRLMDVYPGPVNLDRAQLAHTIDALIACSEASTACADACLSERSVADLTRCISSGVICADICATTARVLSRQTGFDAVVNAALLEACLAACVACADECEQHADQHEHCRICAAVCQACANSCRALLAAMRQPAML